MFIDLKKPTDLDFGYNIELMVEALPRLENLEDRISYANRIVGLIKQSHPNWVAKNGTSRPAWDYFFKMAPYNPEDLGIKHPFLNNLRDEAR